MEARPNAAYEMVIGLETHVELLTSAKAFCSCENRFGAEPNSLCCPVCAGHPGALPVLNRQALWLAATAGAALHCEILPRSRFDRKHYAYPDLPKGYQITQFYRPLCENGYLTVRTSAGEKRIGITRIHLEEDAGKLVHNGQGGVFLDLNRCGVPLIEIVTEPDIRSAEEAVAYLRELRAVLTYAGVSDCRMNEGSLRCDVNLSIHKPGQPFGVRTELKNLNSFQSVERAIGAEAARQAAILDSGGTVAQETRRYDQKTGQTLFMRLKEETADYRYFPDPHLPEVCLLPEEIAEIRRSLPPLPEERRTLLMETYGLSPYVADQLTAQPWLADYFDRVTTAARHPVAAANLMLGEVFAQLTLRDTERTGERNQSSLPIEPEHIARLSDMAADGRVNSSIAKKILAALFDRDTDPEAYAAQHNLFTIADEAVLIQAVRRVLDGNPAMVALYRAGKTNVEKALMGRVMAETQGRADAELALDLLRKELGKG